MKTTIIEPNKPLCDCGKRGEWHGDKHGRRSFMCDDCWRKAKEANPQVYMENEQ